MRFQQGFFSIARTCAACGGAGSVVTDPCHTCHGDGRVEREHSISVKIPAGVEDGTRIRYGGGGDAKLTLYTRRLGLTPNYTASSWENPSETWTAKDGVLTVPGLAKHDFRLLVIKKG